MAQTENGYSPFRQNYISQLICVLLTKTPTESHKKAVIQWGTELEPVGKKIYHPKPIWSDSQRCGVIPHPKVFIFYYFLYKDTLKQ